MSYDIIILHLLFQANSRYSVRHSIIILVYLLFFMNVLGMTKNCPNPPTLGIADKADFRRKTKGSRHMDETTRTSTEGTQKGTEGTQGEKTFTQEDVNRIVQERLAKEKGRVTGNAGDELDKRAAELDLRERKLTAREKLRENGLPDYLADALNMNTDEDFQKSLEAVLKMKGETGGSTGAKPVGTMSPIGMVQGMGTKVDDPVRKAFGLR